MGADLIGRGLLAAIRAKLTGTNAALDRLVGPAKGLGPVPFSDPTPRLPTFGSATYDFTPAASATDIAAFYMNGYGRVAYVTRVAVSGIADAAAVRTILLQRSANGGGGTSAVQQTAKYDMRSSAAISGFYVYSANRASGGNGVSGTRPIVGRAQNLYLGVAGTPGNTVEWTFSGDDRPRVRDLTEWLVLNWLGNSVPTGTKLTIDIEWTEEALPPVQFSGDSTTSNATTLFAELGMQNGLNAIANVFNAGNNGLRLQDGILNTNSPPYPIVGGANILARYNYLPGVFVLSWGINDLRTGAGTRAYMVSLIDCALQWIKYGVQSGATFSSTHPDGDGSIFTAPGTVNASPDARVILWSPNTLTTDGNGSSYVALTGRFSSGYTVGQAAQVISDDLYEAYESFRDDPRVWRVVHKRDIFGGTCPTVATSGQYAFDAGLTDTTESLMTDILHPNARGQRLLARQIAPVIRDAIADIYASSELI